jgi:hypothetical protein
MIGHQIKSLNSAQTSIILVSMFVLAFISFVLPTLF